MIKEYILEKSKSRQRIEVIPDEYDNWFINITWVAIKSGKIVRKSCIIRKDLEMWIEFFQRKGWKIVYTYM